MDPRLLPDADGVIDLTILDDDLSIDLVAAELDALSINWDHDLSQTNTLRGRPIIASPFMSLSSLPVNPPYPPYNYADHIPKPKVTYIKREEDVDERVDKLNGAIGLDLEWPFSREGDKEIEGKVSLVQLCDVKTILLIHVSKMKRFPQKVKELIESSKVPKMGVNIRNDGVKLFCDYGIIASNLIELGALAGEVNHNFASTFRRPIVSLKIIVSYYLKKNLDKGPRTSDWSKDLTLEQMNYASNDVYCGFMVYKSLMETAHSSKIQLLPERYTADLANELKVPDNAPVSLIGNTSAHPPGNEAPHRYAYTLWRQGYGLLGICIRMGDRAHPQRETVVISHIIRALTEDPALPFSMTALTSLLKLVSSSWAHDRDTIERWTREGRGIDKNRARG